MPQQTIYIRNKLEVLPGNVINVPGCEPISSLTSTALAREYRCQCHAAVIPVEDALRLIPGSRLVRVLRPTGQTGTGIFLELPQGPPANGNVCPPCCLPDWYAILRKNAKVRNVEEESSSESVCSNAIDFGGCPREYDPVLHPRDPNQRPSEAPLGAGL